MKRFFIFNFCILIALSLSAQTQLDLKSYLKENKIDAKQSKDGIFYTVDKKGKGAMPKKGDYVMVNYVGKLLDGKVFDQSEANDPFVFQVGYRQVIRGWDLGIPLYKVGAKGSLYVPPSLAYGTRGAGAIPPNSPLIFEIELVKIMNLGEYDKYMVELEQKERRAFEAHVKTQFVKDKKLINEYALDNKLKTKRTPSGLSYVITKKGKGAKAKAGDQLKVSYEGQLLDGSVFDSSKGKKPYEFVLGQKKVIDGWEEGLQFFNKGSEGWLLIPSKLGYGPLAIKEDGIDLPADAVLVFKIEVVDINPLVKK